MVTGVSGSPLSWTFANTRHGSELNRGRKSVLDPWIAHLGHLRDPHGEQRIIGIRLAGGQRAHEQGTAVGRVRDLLLQRELPPAEASNAILNHLITVGNPR